MANKNHRNNFIHHQKNGDYGGAEDLVQAEKKYLESRNKNGKKIWWALQFLVAAFGLLFFLWV
ncbi:MAG TPA: hypothetical protein EYP51_07360 [Thiotrichales bacterium]|nr:hypothetical protein [Thiotrichales bacterium]